MVSVVWWRPQGKFWELALASGGVAQSCSSPRREGISHIPFFTDFDLDLSISLPVCRQAVGEKLKEPVGDN